MVAQQKFNVSTMAGSLMEVRYMFKMKELLLKIHAKYSFIRSLIV